MSLSECPLFFAMISSQSTRESNPGDGQAKGSWKAGIEAVGRAALSTRRSAAHSGRPLRGNEIGAARYSHLRAGREAGHFLTAT